MNYRFTRRAEDCLDEIVDRIAADKPGAAKKFYHRVIETCQSATEFPFTGREVKYFNDPKIRCKNVKGYEHYLIFYRVRRKEIVISLVAHGARDLPNIIGEI